MKTHLASATIDLGNGIVYTIQEHATKKMFGSPLHVVTKTDNGIVVKTMEGCSLFNAIHVVDNDRAADLHARFEALYVQNDEGMYVLRD